MDEIKHILFGVFAIVMISVLEAYALYVGVNGMGLTLAIGAITGIAAGIIGFKWGKVTVEK